MNKTIKKILNQTLNDICSLRFILAVLLFVLSCLISDVFYSDGMQYERRTILELLLTDDWKGQMYSTVDFSSTAILRNFNGSLWFPMLLVLLFSFPSVSAFLEEYYSGHYYSSISRVSCREYGVIKAVSAGLTGMVIFLAGYLIFAAIVLPNFPSIEVYPPEKAEYYLLAYGDLDADYFIRLFSNMLALAFVTPMAILVLSMAIQDVYFVFGLPMLVVFLIEKAALRVGILFPELYNLGQGWWQLLVPSYYAGMYDRFTFITQLPYPCFLVLMLLYAVLLLCLFILLIKRRIARYA